MPTRQQPVDMSIIIPVLNDNERLVHCLLALSRQTTRYRFEAIVVDNGSVISPCIFGRQFPFTKFYHEKIKGSYRARNRGVSEASGNVLAFTDADCIPRHDWVQKAMTAWQHDEKALIAGRIDLVFNNPNMRNVAELHEAMFAFQQERNVQHGYAVTANLIVGKKLFKSLNGFNPDTLSGGDVEFSRRATQEGLKLRYVDNVVVRHPARNKIKELTKKKKRIISGLYSLRQSDVNIAREFRLLQLIKHLLPPVLTYRTLRRRVANGEITDGELFKVMIVVYYQKLLSFVYKAALIYTN